MCTDIYMYEPPSRYHIVDTLMMKGHRVTAHAAHALRPEYSVVRFSITNLDKHQADFKAAPQLIPRSQET